MAKIIGQIESLKSLRAELNKKKISRFNSIGDINRFREDYPKEKKKVIEFHENLINDEIKQKAERINENKNWIEQKRNDKIKELDENLANYKKLKEKSEIKISSAFLLIKPFIFYKIRKLNKKILGLTNNYDLIILNSIRNIRKEITLDSINLSYLTDNKQKIILNRSKADIDELEYVKSAVDDLRTLIAGAIGESLVEKEIAKLSNDYTLINDFSLGFKPPIYNKSSNERIYSIQIDHLLISRAGLFILETKNWSKESINTTDLRSPVDQIIRTSYALFVVANNQIKLDNHHWGAKQIPIRNIIVMIHAKPKEEFKYVKIKLLNELNSYVEYFDPIFTKTEFGNIVNSLVRLSNNNTIANNNLSII